MLWHCGCFSFNLTFSCRKSNVHVSSACKQFVTYNNNTQLLLFSSSFFLSFIMIFSLLKNSKLPKCLLREDLFLLCKRYPQINLGRQPPLISGQMKTGNEGNIVSTNPSAECQGSPGHVCKIPQNALKRFSLSLCCCRCLSHLARADRQLLFQYSCTICFCFSFLCSFATTALYWYSLRFS